MNARTRRRLLVNLGMVILISSLVSLALIHGLMRPLQLSSSDLLFRTKPNSSARFAVLVAIDDRSVAELRSQGRVFNWPRQLYARAIDNLKAAGARFIALDILFDSPAEGDAELAHAIRQANNVVLAEGIEGIVCRPGVPAQSLRFDSTLQQLPEFRDGAVLIGHANQCPDTDGTIRATPLRVNVAGQDMAALPLTAAAAFLRRPQDVAAPIQDGKLMFVGREIPIDQEGLMWISYLGDAYDSTSDSTTPPTFPSISFVDAVNNSFPPEGVRSKMVFIGITATAFADDYWTPVSRVAKMDGVEIHANAFETIMRPDEFIVPATRQATVGVIYVAGLVAVVALSFLAPVPAVIVGVFAGLAYLRGCLRSLLASQASEHELAHRGVDHRLADLGQGLVVLAQAAVPAQPAEGALHHPAFGQHDEAAGILRLRSGPPRLTISSTQVASAATQAINCPA